MLRQSLLVVVMGCAAGLFAAFMVARWVQPLLFHVRLLEPWVLLSVTVLFIMVTLLAAFIPARSASRTDLMEVLRD